MKVGPQPPDFATMGLEELLKHWSGLLLWLGIRPMFQRMIEADLSFPEHIVLQSLAHGEMTVASVAECLFITHSAASRAVDRLVEAGLVYREENPQNRRQKVLRLAPAGEALVLDFEQIIAQGIRPTIGCLSHEEQEECRMLIAKILLSQCPFNDEGAMPVDAAAS